MNKKFLIIIFLSLFLSTVAYADLNANISNVWHFNDSGNLIDYVGGVDCTTVDVSEKDVNGINGIAWNFIQASTDEVICPTDTWRGKAEFSVIIWVNFTSVGDYDFLWATQDTNNFIGSTIDSGTKTQFVFSTSNDLEGLSARNAPAISPDTWSMFAITYDGANATSYINGVQHNSALITGTTAGSSGAWAFGARSDGGAYHINGIIDEAYFWNRSLTSDEMTELWNSGDGNFYPFASVDTTSPSMDNLQNNASTITKINNVVNWSVDISDNVALDGYFFANNNSGTLTNNSFTSLGGESSVSVDELVTITQIRDNYICGQFWANDTSGNFIQSSLSCFTVDNTPPTQATIYSPLNDTTYNYLDINYSSYDADGDSITFYWWVDGVFNRSAVDTNMTNWIAGNGSYEGYIAVFDGTDGGINSEHIFFYMDIENPMITTYYPSEDNTTIVQRPADSMRLNSTFTDNRFLYVYNISIKRISDNLSMFNTSSYIENTTYYFNYTLDTLNWSIGQYEEKIRVCDSHTANEIKEAKSITKNNSLLSYNFDDTIIKIESITGNERDTRTIKEKDRYTFEFEYSEKISKKILKLSSNGNIRYLENSPYMGHFVIDDMLWVDFENYEVHVEKNKDYYLIYIDSSEEILKFSSVGYLNCETEYYIFTIKDEPSYSIDLISSELFNKKAFNIQSVSGLIFFLLTLLMFISFVIFSEKTRIPFFVLMTSITGIFFGLLYAVTISTLLGAIFMIISVCYIIRIIEFL